MALQIATEEIWDTIIFSLLKSPRSKRVKNKLNPLDGVCTYLSNLWTPLLFKKSIFDTNRKLCIHIWLTTISFRVDHCVRSSIHSATEYLNIRIKYQLLSWKKIFREYFSIKHFFFGTRIREYGHYGHNNLLHNLLFSVSLCKYVLDIKTLSIPLSKVIFDYINACHIWRFHLLWISITIKNIHYPGEGDTKEGGWVKWP